jgi:tetratricopeptide (TPR) repeat protein
VPREVDETLTYDDGTGPGKVGPSDLPRGTAVERYLILDRVGEGGMGIVYAAFDPALDRRVALKFLNRNRSDASDVFERRLLREAQAMARLSHPNVVAAYDVGTFYGHVFVAMEFVDGTDLRRWLREPGRTFDEIVDAFCAAGRGLAAAHAAGVVHRDFKPGNVLVDRSDRPRVTDFGLSRAAQSGSADAIAGEEPESEERPRTLLSGQFDTSLTRTGAVLGTPSYMSPEQLLGRSVDERSDQFSFSVALYEAVHGEHPFRGSDTSQLVDNAVAGRVAPPPPSANVPRWCRRALLRGLQTRPEDRFPSMDALLAELSERPRRRRRNLVVAAIAALVAAAGVLALWPGDPERAAPRCQNGSARLDRIWDAPRQESARAAFERAGRGGAETWKSFAAILDRRTSAWAAMHDQACAATHVHGGQSAEVLDLRMECLDRKLQEMNALVEAFADKPDAAALDRSVEAADKLSPISACADIANLRAVVPLPEDAAARAKVAAVRQRLARSRALYDAGRYEQGRAYMAPLKAEADALGYAPLASEAAKALADHLSVLDKLEEAEKALFEAAEKAVSGRDAELEAEAWVSLVSNYARQGKVAEGLLAARTAELAVGRAHADPALRARLMGNTGYVNRNAGNLTAAFDYFRRAADLRKQSVGVGSTLYADALGNAGGVLVDLGRTREALTYIEESLAVRRAVLRPGHPDLAFSYHALGVANSDLGRFRHARDSLQQAVDLRTAELGPEHTETLFSLQSLAQAESGLGNYARSLELYDRLLTIQRRVLGPDHIFLGAVYLEVGDTQRSAGLLDRAEQSLRSAIAHNARLGAPEHVNTGFALTSLGLLHNGRGQHRLGLEECRRAMAILRKELGDDSSGLSWTQECIGEALLGAGDVLAARAELEAALEGASKPDAAPQRIAALRFQLARALDTIPSEKTRARELARMALDQLRAAEGAPPELVARIEAWLAPAKDGQRRDQRREQGR